MQKWRCGLTGCRDPKASNAAMSSSSSFKKGINCFNCRYEGHYAHKCRKPKRQDDHHRGTAPRAHLNMLEVHEDGPDNHKEPEKGHPNAEGWTEDPPEHAVDKSRFMNLMDIYSVIDKEEDDDELIGYLGAMHPIKDTVMGLDDEIVYCRAINATYRELSQWQLIFVEDKGQQVPKGSTGEDNQEWTWEEPYGAVHQGDCENCTCYSRHLREALGNDIPSALVATNYPSAMAWCKFDRGWDTYKRAEVYSEWAVAQKEIGGDNGGPHYEVVYCTYM